MLAIEEIRPELEGRYFVQRDNPAGSMGDMRAPEGIPGAVFADSGELLSWLTEGVRDGWTIDLLGPGNYRIVQIEEIEVLAYNVEAL